MSMETKGLDTTDLDERISRIYGEVALEPERAFHLGAQGAL